VNAKYINGAVLSPNDAMSFDARFYMFVIGRHHWKTTSTWGGIPMVFSFNRLVRLAVVFNMFTGVTRQ